MKKPNPTARARAAASTKQEVSSPNRPINGKSRTVTGWKEGRENWRNLRPSVREICWRKEDVHLWVSPPPSHTPLRVGSKWQVSVETHTVGFVKYSYVWNGCISWADRDISVAVSYIFFSLAVSHPPAVTDTLRLCPKDSSTAAAHPLGLYRKWCHVSNAHHHPLPSCQPTTHLRGHTNTHRPTVFSFPLPLVRPF